MKYLLVIFLLLAGCKPADPYLPGGCRTFAVATWGENLAPWQDFDWSRYNVVDEPLLSWGRPGGLEIVYDEVNQRMDSLRANFASSPKPTWVNWSSEEFDLIYRSDLPALLGWNVYVESNVVSLDDYAGPVDWWLGRTTDRLQTLFEHLQPNQKMALLPEAFPLRYESEDDLILMNRLYFAWALTHSDKIEVFTPYLWSGGISDMPRLREALADLMSKYPRCE